MSDINSIFPSANTDQGRKTSKKGLKIASIIVFIGLVIAAAYVYWPREAQGFTADMRTKIDDREYVSHLKVQGKKLWMESLTGRRASIAIVRYDKKTNWLLIPDSRQYTEFSLEEFNDTVPQFFNPNIKIEKTRQGEEKVDKIPAVKYKVKISLGDKKYEGLLWEAKDRPGYPLKWEDAKTKLTVTWEKAKITKLPNSVFEIPDGYEKLENKNAQAS